MSWEAYRWTAKTPSELFHTLGPHGVDHLVRQALDACWRELPDDRRTLAAVTHSARDVLGRNVRVWNRIKKPDPAAFFDDLLPKPADQFLRQAMVTCWMMMPRTGGRKVGEVTTIVTRIFERNLDAWEEDNATLTGKKPKKGGGVIAKKSGPKSTGKKASSSKKVAKKPAKKKR
jgi:hypothetical protein